MDLLGEADWVLLDEATDRVENLINIRALRRLMPHLRFDGALGKVWEERRLLVAGPLLRRAKHRLGRVDDLLHALATNGGLLGRHSRELRCDKAVSVTRALIAALQVVGAAPPINKVLLLTACVVSEPLIELGEELVLRR